MLKALFMSVVTRRVCKGGVGFSLKLSSICRVRFSGWGKLIGKRLPNGPE